MVLARTAAAALALTALALPACSGDEEPAPAGRAPAAHAPARRDPTPAPADPERPRLGGPLRPATPPPTSYHLDPDQVDYVPSRRRREAESGKELELVLRSSPPGATAAVDGTIVGPTPAYWRGEATGKPREFTFVLSGYAMARYRFVPLRGGVVHATLEQVATKPE